MRAPQPKSNTMTPLQQQIAAAHLELIQLTLAAAHDPHAQAQLIILLDTMHGDGWQALSHAVQTRLGLSTQEHTACALDDEDRSILELIEHAQQQPAAFQEFAQQAAAHNLQHTAQALAALIYAATQGEREALETLAELHQAADTPAALATSAALIHIVEGERQIDVLSQMLPEEQAQLIQMVLTALHEIEA
ncbi:MAG: hypothetical protein B7Y40_03485 [Gammaproteobacteria bacterium 28-57-27]|nr:MAG: hypothetical protein B7Y40_03485 [Gammaproteobacteria bacterium 28-57-27]